MKKNELDAIKTNSIGEFTARRIEAIGTVDKDNVPHMDFKSPALTDYANRLALAVATTGAKSNETAAILYTIDRDKVYKDDGFDSLPDFVKAAGLNTANDASGIYKLAKAGALLMSNDSDVADWASTCNTTALSIIGTLDSDTVAEAVKSGKLPVHIPVKEAKDFVKRVKGDKGGVKVVKCYDYSLTWYTVKGISTVIRENVPGIDALPEAGSYNFTKVPVPSGMPAELTATYVGTPKECNAAGHGVFMVYAKKHTVKEDKPVKGLDVSTLDLSSMTPDQLAQLAALVKAATDKA